MNRRLFLQSASALPLTAASPGGPLRGLHLSAPRPEDMETALRFIQDALPKEGVNTLFLEFNYRVRSRRCPDIVDEPALTPEQVQSLAAAARLAGVKLIPQINLLGHQSWAKTIFALLRVHPEFD
ncbi:MAG: hypothetical protein HXY18_03770, partial [Bryobacteraceae bacterium]|nr:hypothetical protein [Bryobacteraceae bacterium]